MAKVLIVSSSFPSKIGDTSGVFIYTLFSELIKKYQAEILVPHIFDFEERRGIHSFRYFFQKWETLSYEPGILQNIRNRPWKVLLIPPFIIGQLMAILRLVRADTDLKILHAQWWVPQGIAAVLYKIIFNRKIKIVCTIHGPDIFSLKNKFWVMMRKIIFPYFDHIIVTSEIAKKQIVKEIPAELDISVIPAGIRLSDFTYLKNQIDRKNPHLLFVGRIATLKGIWELLGAMELLTKAISGVRLTVIGSGHEQNIFKNEIRKRNLDQVITVLGRINNKELQIYYRRTDLFILPSHVEGVPVVVMEAMASGVIVIASDVGGTATLVHNGKTGFLIPPHSADSIAQMVLTIVKEYSDTTLDTIRDNAYELIKNGLFNLEYQVDALTHIYETLDK